MENGLHAGLPYEIEELGYQPGTVGRRLSQTELEVRPSPRSARVDPRDPLDP